VRGKNFWGWGEFSDPLTIKSAKYPSQAIAVTTSIDAATGGIRIDWVAPYTNEQTITAYAIEVKEGAALSATTYIASASCNGADSTTFANMYCVIPMSELRASPYTYAFRELVVARVRAYNSYGWGDDWSADNTIGALTRIEASKMGAISVDAFTTTITQVSVYWTALALGTDTGDSAILSYHL
jgi:hypothetical protein